MAQQGFGRRQSTSHAVADRSATARSASPPELGRNSLAANANRSAGKSVMILAAVGGLVLLTALGGVFSYSAATRAGAAAPPQQTAPTPRECRGQADCTNQYNVALTCGSSDEARTVSIVAIDAEAAERKAERYNRECRSRNIVFVTSLAKSAAANTFGAARVPEPSRHLTDHKASSSKVSDSGSHTRLRFRRR